MQMYTHKLQVPTRGKGLYEITTSIAAWLQEKDIDTGLLTPAPGKRSACEWKGMASYFHVGSGDRLAEHAAWTYEDPKDAYSALRGHIAFYAGRLDACQLDEELVTPQGGAFYGGWVTAEIVGPHKGEAGTEGW